MMKKNIPFIFLAALVVVSLSAGPIVSAWNANKTTVDNADTIMMSDNSAAIGSREGFITFGNLLAWFQDNLTFTTNTDNQTADEVDDTSTTKKFTTAAEKAVWDAKEDGLVCTDGQIKKHNGTTWICAADDNSGGITLTQTLGGGSTTEAPSEAAVDAALAGKMDASSADHLTIASNGFLGIDYNSGSPQWIPGTFGSGFSFNATNGLLDYTFTVGDVTDLFTGAGDYLKADGTTGTPTGGSGLSVIERTTAPSAGDLDENTIAVDTTNGNAYMQSSSGLASWSITWTSNPTGGISDDFSTDTSANYTAISGAGISISGGFAVSATSWGGASAYHNTSTGSDNHYVKAVVERTAADAAGVIFAFDPVTNGGYVAYPVTKGIAVKSIATDGTLTGLTTHIVGGDIAADETGTLKVEIDSGTAEIFWNTVSLGTQSITVHGQYVGLYWDNDSNQAATADDFAGGSL